MRSIAREIEALKKLIPAAEPTYPPLYMPPKIGREAISARMFVTALVCRSSPVEVIVASLERLPRAEESGPNEACHIVEIVQRNDPEQVMQYLGFAVSELEAEIADRKKYRDFSHMYEWLVSDESLSGALLLATDILNTYRGATR